MKTEEELYAVRSYETKPQRPLTLSLVVLYALAVALIVFTIVIVFPEWLQ